MTKSWPLDYGAAKCGYSFAYCWITNNFIVSQLEIFADPKKTRKIPLSNRISSFYIDEETLEF